MPIFRCLWQWLFPFSWSDLRSSSAIEQEADSVYLFWRPEYYGILEDNYHNDLHGIGEIIIAKNCNGSIGLVRVKLDSYTSLIEDMSGNHKRKRLQQLKQQNLLNQAAKNEAFNQLVDKFGLK